MKPKQYTIPYAVIGRMQYTCKQPEGDGALTKAGVLQPGRVVWLDGPVKDGVTTTGFAQGIGVVELDATLLQRV